MRNSSLFLSAAVLVLCGLSTGVTASEAGFLDLKDREAAMPPVDRQTYAPPPRPEYFEQRVAPPASGELNGQLYLGDLAGGVGYGAMGYGGGGYGGGGYGGGFFGAPYALGSAAQARAFRLARLTGFGRGFGHPGFGRGFGVGVGRGFGAGFGGGFGAGGFRGGFGGGGFGGR
jgi:hypothetical protein